MSERYEISDQGDGTAIVIDTHTDQPVFTADGTRVYEAPTENAQWTADRLNRAEARKVRQEEERKSAPAPEPTPEPENLMDWERELLALPLAESEPEPVRPNPAALLHVMAHAEPTDADGTPIDYDGTPIAPAPVVRPVEKVDYPRMAGKAIGSIGVLSSRLASIGRWLDALEDGSVSPEFAMRELRKAQTEARAYADNVYEELTAREWN